MKTVRVPTYHRRRKNGTSYRVKAYSRKHRAKGKTFRYKKVGTYYVRFDNLGNFRGSKITKFARSSRGGIPKTT